MRTKHCEGGSASSWMWHEFFVSWLGQRVGMAPDKELVFNMRAVSFDNADKVGMVPENRLPCSNLSRCSSERNRANTREIADKEVNKVQLLNCGGKVPPIKLSYNSLVIYYICWE